MEHHPLDEGERIAPSLFTSSASVCFWLFQAVGRPSSSNRKRFLTPFFLKIALQAGLLFAMDPVGSQRSLEAFKIFLARDTGDHPVSFHKTFVQILLPVRFILIEFL